jgi:PadR family transcriptional regulator PadR
MPKARTDLLQGTLDLIVLKVLELEPMHGWGITQRIRQISEEVLQVGQGSLYPALYRLEEQDLIESEWQTTDNHRQARYYRLTAKGRKRVAVETEQFERMSAAVFRIIRSH